MARYQDPVTRAFMSKEAAEARGIAPMPEPAPPAPTLVTEADDASVDADAVAAASADADAQPSKRRPRKGGRTWTKEQRAKASASHRANAAAKKATVPAVTDAAIRDGMAQLYGMLAMAASPFDPQIGQAIAACTEENQFGPGAPDAWVALSRQYPAVRAAIASMGGSAAIAAMFTAHLPLLMVVQARVASRGVFGQPAGPATEPADQDAAPSDNGQSTYYTGAPVA